MSVLLIGDILFKVNCYVGCIVEFWSVVVYLVLVLWLCFQLEEQVWGLLYDVYEVFIGDIVMFVVMFIVN